MSVLVEFSMFPTDKGESVSSYVTRIIKMIDESGIPYKLTSMGTVFETETMDEALELIKKAYQQLEPDCNRVYSVVKFDIRKGKSNRMAQKIKSVESKLEREVSK
ncbi:MTH1187 family thiamine-binding protein [Desulfurobacterium crinifex]